jgi:hypothetical protein
VGATTNQLTTPAVGAKRDSHWKFAVRALAPLVRVLLRFGFSCDELNTMIRKIAVDAALEHREFRVREKAFTAQAAVVTGLSRKEVKRLRESESLRGLLDVRQSNRGARVLDGWMRDPRCRDDNGQVRKELPFQSSVGMSFQQLVREYGGDIPARAILNSLLDNGVVTEEGSSIKLVTIHYVPSQDSDELPEALGMCMHDALSNAEYNLRPGRKESRFIREWFQPNMPVENLAEAHRIIRQETMELGDRLDAKLARLADNKPQANKRYRRVGLGAFAIDASSELGEETDD